MATNLPANPSAKTPHQHTLGRSTVIVLVSLIVVLVLCIAFSWTTRDAMEHLPFLDRQVKTQIPMDSQQTIVDLGPWQTAQALAPLAVSAEERQYAREAERLAAHEVDQAFASALRQASAIPPAITSETLALSQKVARLQETVQEDQTRVQSLAVAANPSASAKMNRDRAVSGTDDLEIAKAQLALDQDDLADAQRDLARASGDQRARIQQELTAHQAAVSKYNAQSREQGETAVLSARQHGTLAGRLMAWSAQRNRYQLIEQAMRQAQADVTLLTAQHNSLEAQATTSPASPGVDSSGSGAGSASGAAPDTAVKLARIEQRSKQRQLLGIYDDRIQTQGQLATVYGKWADQLLLQHRIMLHLILQSLALIAFILICVIVSNELVRRFLERPSLDGRRMHTLRMLTKLGVQLLGFALILLVVFGVPEQISTVLGLTTAGLTVALQSFILAFFGWFILMGKNGIHVGDRVEINGVGGEVIEISLFRTTMLETGNWTDKGHPTGRRVTFLNNFAITGQYFNFSTVGQWMWDEISVSVPASSDTYAMVEFVHKAVADETEKDARLAGEAWKRVPSQNGLSQFSATASVNLRPAASGLDLVVRYVTRASERFDMRNRVYQRVIDALHKPS